MHWRLLAMAVLSGLALACSEPPHKEMHQAQGALDAARAAGAETFAPDEFREAQNLLQQSEQAVTQRDYRLALRHALDARERAQEAARAAADRKAEARGQAERSMAAAELAVRSAQQRLTRARAARVRARELAPLATAISNAEASLQKARAAMTDGAYLDARKQTDGLDARLAEAIKAFEARQPARPARRRR
jgi:hypothetical protein